MIGVQLQGGLGNQLWQYAAARALAHRHDIYVSLDLSKLPKTPKPHCVYGLDAFNIPDSVQSLQSPQSAQSPSLGFKPIDNRLYVEKSLRYDPELMNQPDGITLVGYWQSHLYIEPIRSILLPELTLRSPRSYTYKGYAAQILETPNSVAVHFRRRDAVDNSPGAKFHGTPPNNYYAEAIAEMTKWIGKATYFVFSDDPQWVMENWAFDHIIVRTTPAEDLTLISLCQHAIIANSSFSFWGAWLGAHQRDGIVVAPQRWYLNEEAQSQTEDLCPPSWVRL